MKGSTAHSFKGKKGVIDFNDCNWSDATGHVDLFNAKLNYESCMANSQPVQNGETRTDTVKKAHSGVFLR